MYLFCIFCSCSAGSGLWLLYTSELSLASSALAEYALAIVQLLPLVQPGPYLAPSLAPSLLLAYLVTLTSPLGGFSSLPSGDPSSSPLYL